MDELDNRLIRALKRDGRAPVQTLAADLGVTRATIRARLNRLEAGGEIVGYSVLTRADVAPHPVRGLMMLEVQGRGADKISRALRAMPAVARVHATNGTWDLIAEIGTASLEAFDTVLTTIRQIDGITRSETSLLLSTRA
ncbi:DNA-binding transcriptional regulator, Lrp family [Loktanella sp. DSM 29012]|uniref:Lrp/AsnC family transcriptional regulator n=1 Tax=Loktanella sp. DSM 29012 TaxID=1881056 RepID=UPI0008C9E15C|nr:Lrp/AsnC family transcriptional regulator [Loktanella sp. DSM 29012]SEQ24459.1 DNA-binding transcriptional regulator, Lrp family [Loktanella sp. DSM 29012]